MAASFFKLSGSYIADPAVGAPSGDPGIGTPFDERLSLARKHTDELELTVDAFVPVTFGGLTDVHALVVSVPGGAATLRVTSGAGVAQLIPVGEFLAIVSQDDPFTAIDVQRPAGVTTTVKVFLGEKA